MSEECADQITAIAFALAKSLQNLPGLQVPARTRNCSDCATIGPTVNVCTVEDVAAFTFLMETFFLKRPVPESTVLGDGRVPAQTLKSTQEIKTLWTKILEKTTGGTR